MPLSEDHWTKYYGEPAPICPYCDITIDIHQYELYDLYEDGHHEINCPDCKKAIKVVSDATFKFSTNEQGD